MSQYRYLKLRNGEDIVAMTVVNDTNGTVEMTLPCNIALTPSMVGKGTVIKLSPLVPFTKDNRVVIAANEVVYTTTIDDKFIQFYDKACKDWIHLRDEIGLNVMSPKQELTTGQDLLERFASEMKDKMLSPEEEIFDTILKYLTCLLCHDSDRTIVCHNKFHRENIDICEVNI